MHLSKEFEAFLIVCAAGSSTVFGASVVFNGKLVNLANEKFLAGSISFAAGVMVYASFAEIMVKSYLAFENHGISSHFAHAYAAISFFSGILCYLGIDQFLRLFDGYDTHKVNLKSFNVSADLDGVKVSMAEDGTCSQVTASVSSTTYRVNGNNAHLRGASGSFIDGELVQSDRLRELSLSTAREEKMIERIGVMTAVATGIHNFPEGFAAFVGTLADPVVGGALAIAIAMHNISEGLCIAIPMFYATGDRWKAFFWAALSGITEPLGAGLGWIILRDYFDDRVYGSVFGIIAGMMVCKSFQQLFPTAIRYDPSNKISSKFVLFGMMVMAVSLVLFVY